MKKILIFGITDLAENLYYHLKSEDKIVDGFCINEAYITSYQLFGLPVYSFEKLSSIFEDCEIEFYVCIGYKKMNNFRKKIFSEIEEKGYVVKSYRHRTAQVYASSIGKGNLFFENSYVGMYSNIGDGNIFYPGSMVAHHTDVGNFNFFSISSSIAGKVKIGNLNFLGNNASTKDRINIGNEVLVGASAYVDRNLYDGQVIVPNKSIILDNKKSLDFL